MRDLPPYKIVAVPIYRLDDREEVEGCTDPQKPDTDEDGLTDGEEANTYFTNPCNPDTDGDGCDDGDEVNTYGTDPNVGGDCPPV